MVRERRRERRQRVLRALREHAQRGGEAPFQPDPEHHAADIADVLWLDFSPEEALLIFWQLPPEVAAEVLAESEDPQREKLLVQASPEKLGGLVRNMSADDAADVLEILPEEVRAAVLRNLQPDQARNLRHLGEYGGETAGGMMTTEFIAVPPEEHVGDVLKRIKRDEGGAETIHNVYAVEGDGILKGVVSTRELIEAGIHQPLSEILNPDVIKARVDEDQEEVAQRILHYNLSAIPVTDLRGVLVGIITVDDALEVLEEEATEDALLLGGASPDSYTSEPLLWKVRHRAPVLLITVLGGAVISRVMAIWTHPDPGAESWRVLVPFLPMVLGLAGNVGTQTAAVAVRGIALGQIGPGRRKPFLFSEMKLGVSLGFLSGLLVTLAAWWLARDLSVAASVGTALFFAMSWTATMSCSVAMGSQVLGLDPAFVSGPVQTAISDLSATTLFFGTASLLLANVS